MTIYIEDFFIQNVLINFCLLRLIFLTTKSNTTLYKLIFSSIFGAGFSVIAAIYIENQILMNLLKLMCSVIMTTLAFKTNLKQYVFNLILLFLYTYAIGGIITNFSTTNIKTNFGIITVSKFNLWQIVLGFVLFTYIFELVIKLIKQKFLQSNFIYKVKLKNNNHQITINAFLDTGNMLKIDNQPVLILDLQSFLTLQQINIVNFLLTKSKEINLNTVTGDNKMKIFQIDEMQVKFNKKLKVLRNQIVAVNTNNLFKKTNYQALLSLAFV